MKTRERNAWIVGALALLMVIPFGAWSQKFTASVSKKKVAVGEMFQLDFSINASAKNFVPPSLSNFKIYQGPHPSYINQNINGYVTQSTTITYVLACPQEGTFTIEPATITAGGTTFQSNAITIEAVKPSSGQQSQSSQGAVSSTDNLFVRTSASKSKAYVGEQITVTHKVYTRMNLKGFQDAKFPSYNGFLMQEAGKPAQYEIAHENVDGLTYSVVEIRRVFLFPQRAGKIEIEPTQVECVVREKTGKRNDPFEQFFGHDPFFSFDTYRDALYSVRSNPVTLEILPLPENGKPADFPGAVGSFSVNSAIDKEKVKTNEGINLKITITGKGNIKLADAPKINFPAEFETYDPKTSENISTTAAGVSGTKTFEYLLIPRHAGEYTLRPADFSYFDPEKKTYVTLPSKEFSITVEKGENTAAGTAPMVSGVTKEDVKMFGSDIRFIKTGNSELRKKDEIFFGSPLFIAGFSIPPLLFLAFLLVRREHIRRNSDLVAVRRRKASGIAKKYLALAEKSMKKNDQENFFVNVLAALYNYMGNKMNIPAAEQSKEKTIEVLRAKHVPEETISELVMLMDECEFARYAPGMQSGNLQDVYARAEKIINKIDDAV